MVIMLSDAFEKWQDFKKQEEAQRQAKVAWDEAIAEEQATIQYLKKALQNREKKKLR